MKAPAVAFDVHHALTPELRERIIDDIRTRIQEPSYRLLSPEQLRELGRLDTGGPPLVSLHLQLTPERRVGRAWHSAFSALAHKVSQNTGQETARGGRGRPRPDRARAKRPVARPWPRRRVFRVPRSGNLAPDCAANSIARPGRLRQSTLSATLVARLGPARSYAYRPALAPTEPVLCDPSWQHRGDLPGQGAAHMRNAHGPGPRDRRDAVATQVLKNEAKALAPMAEMIGHEFETSHILLSAPPDMSAAFRDHLSRSSLERVAPFEVSIYASPAEIAAAAAPVQQQLRKRAERQVVYRLCEAAPGAVSTGTQETLDCLRDGRVLSLIADDSYAARGMHCRQCLGLFEPPQIAACPRCGSAELEPLDDLVEAALQQALDQKAAVTFIRDPGSCCSRHPETRHR
jgi:peptide chain release factor subunit 1